MIVLGRKLLTHLSKEYWEHKVIMLWLPLGITLITLLLQGFSVLTDDGSAPPAPAQFSYTMNETSVDNNPANNSDSQTTTKTVTKNFTASSLLLNLLGRQASATSSPLEPMLIGFSFLMMAMLVLSLLTYSHSCLYGDRARKETLFWRSLPVSEGQNLLCKLLVLLIILPTIYCLMILAYGVGALLLHNFNSWDNWLFLLFKMSELTLIVILFSVLLLPLISWILFCSAAARKAPIFLSLLAPLALALIMKFSLGENYITSTISHYLKSIGAKIKVGPEILQQQIGFLISTEFLVALALSVGLLLASLWLRNNRYDI